MTIQLKPVSPKTTLLSVMRIANVGGLEESPLTMVWMLFAGVKVPVMTFRFSTSEKSNGTEIGSVETNGAKVCAMTVALKTAPLTEPLESAIRKLSASVSTLAIE